MLGAMSISTKTGDAGETSLLYGRRVAKTDPRVAAYGAVDELSSALGLARAELPADALGGDLEKIQRDLIALMGRLALDEQDRERFEQSKMPQFTPEMLAWVDARIARCEASTGTWTDWVLPGANRPSAALEFARAVCRRAERQVLAISPQAVKTYGPVLVYLNRLADLLWLMARMAEKSG